MSTSETTEENNQHEEDRKELFHLDIHAWVDAQQTSHGVRHDDYAQYHAYCTRRLSRLAHKPDDAKSYLVHSSKHASSLPIVDTSSSNNSSGNNTAKQKPAKNSKTGGRHAFCSRSHDTFALTQEVIVEGKNGEDSTTTTTTIPNPVPHVNILWHLLVNAERSWAHANELQKLKTGNNNKSTGRRQPVLKKLKRANKWSKILVEKAKTSANDETQRECEAYAAWMSANFALEKMDYETARKDYACAMSLCYELSGEKGSDEGIDSEAAVKRLERHDLFVTRADTILRPLFRYCQYELKQAGKHTMEEPRLLGGGNTKQPGNSSEDEDSIVFRDQELVLDNKDLRVLLLKLQSVEQEQKEEVEKEDGKSKTKETLFIASLSIIDDAIEVVHSLEQGLSKAASSSGPAIQAKLQQYALWKGYLQFGKTRKVMEHTENLLLSQKTNTTMGSGEKVHVYDAVLKHAKSLLNLPGSDTSRADVEEDDEFILQVQANILRLRALKVYHMGWYYYTQLYKHGPALALLEHSSVLCKRAKEEIAACDEDMSRADEYLQQLEELPLTSAIGAVRAAMTLQQRQHTRKLQKAGAAGDGISSTWQEPVTTDRPLLLRLYEYDGGTSEAPIADLRPMPLPCKPAFYDLAYGYALDQTGSMDVLEAFINEHTVAPFTEKEEEKEGSNNDSSIFGWLTGGSK